MTGARAYVEPNRSDFRHRITTPASTIGFWLPEGSQPQMLAAVG